MKRKGISRRTFLGGALCLPAIHAARADCPNPALRIRVRKDFKSFDPADAWNEDAIISRNLLAPLVRYHRQEGGNGWSWKPHIVEDISDDNPLRYEFRLREEGWLGRSSISSEDVAFSFERIAGMSGGMTDAPNKPLWSALEKVEVFDGRTGAITLKSDRPDLLKTILPGIAGCVVNKTYVEGQGGRFDLNPGPTSGRYNLCGLTRGREAVLIKDVTWKGDAVEIDSAVFEVIKDDETAKELWSEGKIDVFEPGPDVLMRMAAEGYPIVRTSTSRTSMLVMNQNGVLEDQALRRSVQVAVDRQAIGAAAYGDENATVATGLVPGGWTGWNERNFVPFDQTEAHQLVTENKPGGPLRIAARLNDPVIRNIARQVKSDLDSAGFESEIVNPDRSWYAIKENTADILVAMTARQTAGPLQAFWPFVSTNWGWNRSEEFDELYMQAEKFPDDQTILTMQNLLIDTGIVAPLVEDQTAYLVAEHIEPSFDPDGRIGDLGSWAFR